MAYAPHPPRSLQIIPHLKDIEYNRLLAQGSPPSSYRAHPRVTQFAAAAQSHAAVIAAGLGDSILPQTFNGFLAEYRSEQDKHRKLQRTGRIHGGRNGYPAKGTAGR